MRTARGIAQLVMALAGGLSAAGCGTEAGGPAAGGPVFNALPPDPIPPVREARSLVGIPPCRLFTQQQLTTNRIDLPGHAEEAAGFAGCEWRDSAYTREIKIIPDPSNDVLHHAYANRAIFAVFEITQVAGHPAIRTKENVDGKSCDFRVATAERQTFTLRFTSLRHGAEEPCGPAKALAADVVGNLPPLKGR